MRWTIQRRLLLVGATGIAAGALVGGIGLAGLTAIGRSVERMKLTTVAIRNQMECDMMHDAMRGDVLVAVGDPAAGGLEMAKRDLDEHTANFRTHLEENLKSPLSADVKAACGKIQPELERYAAFAESIVQTAGSDHAAAVAQLPAFNAAFHVLEQGMSELSDKITLANGANVAAASAAQRGATTGMLVVMLLASAIFLASGALVFRSVLGPLRRAVKAMDDIAHGEGDLTRRLDAEGQDELAQLGRAFNQFVTRMHDVIGESRRAADGVLQASGELNGASRTISDSAQQQASSLEETAASLEQITATVRQNADNAALANQLATSAGEVAETGGSVVSSAVSAMSEINASSRRIADIITTIDEIAFQTNLLALNAAVEAARAGEQGRGFAVVAAEVRNLAQRSASAAKEIKTLIQDSVRKVEDGATLVNRSGATLDEIVTAVRRVTDVVAEIAAASREQSVGIEEVNRAVTQMDHGTQTNASQTEELSVTAGHLTEQACDLQRLVGSFRLSDGVGVPTTATAAVRPAAAPAPAARAAARASRPGAKATPIASQPANAPRATLTAMAADHGGGLEEF